MRCKGGVGWLLGLPEGCSPLLHLPLKWLGPLGWKSSHKTEGSLLCLGLVSRFPLPGVFLFLLFSLVMVPAISNIFTTKGFFFNLFIGGKDYLFSATTV